MAQHAVLAKVIAHRGASGTAPENTLAALAQAADHGATCAEIDVSVSSDHIAFVHHDDRLDRCTSGSGFLTDHTASELDEICASVNWSNFPNEPLPRLSAVIDLLIEREMSLNLEIKPRSGYEEVTTKATCELLSDHWPKHLGLVLSSFNETALTVAKRVAHALPRALIVGDVPSDWQTKLQLHDAANLHVSASNLTAEQIVDVRQAGYGLYAYTVNDRQRADELLELGIDGIFTDFPQRMLC